jgi:predicted MFS family arabinose efflux permease
LTRRRRPLAWRIGFGSTLALAMTVGTFLPFAFGVLAPFIVTELQLSRSGFGGLTTVFYVVGTPLSLLAGWLVDRFGGRRVLLGLYAAGGLAIALASTATSYAVLLAAAVVGGLSSATGNPVTNQLIAAHIGRGRQGVLVGVKQSGVYLGAVLAGLILPTGAGLVGWRPVLGATASLAVAGVALTFLLVPGTTARDLPPSGDGGGENLGADLRWLAATTLLMGAAAAAVTTYLPLYAFEALGLDTATAGLLAAVSGGVTVAARISWGRAAERWRSARAILVVIAVASALAFALIAAAGPGTVWLVWVGAVVFGGSAAAWTAVVYLLLVRDVDLRATGRSTGLVQLAFYVGYLVSPITFGFVVDRTGSYLPGWTGLVAASALVLLLLAAWRPQGLSPADDPAARARVGR